MDRMFAAAAAVAAGYIVAFVVSSATTTVVDLTNPRTMFVVIVIASAGVASAIAGMRPFSRPARLLLGAGATAALAAIALVGIPFTIGLLVGVLLAAGGTAALLDATGVQRRTQFAGGLVFVATFGWILSTLIRA
jgi:hypothetical protein